VLDPDKDSLLDTLIRIRDFGEELFAPVEIEFVSEEFVEAWGEFELPLETRRHLVLLCKEALHNALKYSRARRVKLGISVSKRRLNIQIADDGVGFDLGEKAKGYGIKNMAHRSAEIGADWHINSTPGNGTEVHITLPLPQMGDGIATE